MSGDPLPKLNYHRVRLLLLKKNVKNDHQSLLLYAVYHKNDHRSTLNFYFPHINCSKLYLNFFHDYVILNIKRGICSNRCLSNELYHIFQKTYIHFMFPSKYIYKTVGHRIPQYLLMQAVYHIQLCFSNDRQTPFSSLCNIS